MTNTPQTSNPTLASNPLNILIKKENNMDEQQLKKKGVNMKLAIFAAKAFMLIVSAILIIATAIRIEHIL